MIYILIACGATMIGHPKCEEVIIFQSLSGCYNMAVEKNHETKETGISYSCDERKKS